MKIFRKGWPWLWLALPALLGIVIAFAMRRIMDDPSGAALQISWSVIPLTIGGLITGFAISGYFLAAGARRKSQKEVLNLRQEQSRNRQRFMQRLDHEFKNPLTVIHAGISTLQPNPHQSTPITTDEQTAILETVSKQTNRLMRLTNDLRKIADLESRPLELTKVDLSEILAEIVESIREQEADREIGLSLPRAPWPLPTLTGDSDLLFLAFYNLVENARKFSEPHDTLEIRAREVDDMVTVEVADTGMGIAADEVPHVWDELYRGENGHAVAGTGLGLPLVRTIIERHSGTVTLSSRVQRGTNVMVQLPIEFGRTP